MLNNLQQMHLKLLQKDSLKKRRNQPDLIGNKISDKIAKPSKTSLHNNSETNEEILGEKYISQELRQKIIDNL